MACRGLDDVACRNPLGMLEKPWCYVAQPPYFERCAVPLCDPPPPPPVTPVVTAASSRWVMLLAILISIAGLLLIALLVVVIVKIMHGTWSCTSATAKATPTRTSETASSDGPGRKLSDVTTVMSGRTMHPHHQPSAGPSAGPSVGRTHSQSSMSRRQSSHGGRGNSPMAADQYPAVELAEAPMATNSVADRPVTDPARYEADQGSSPIGRMPPAPASDSQHSAQSPGSHRHAYSLGGYSGPMPAVHPAEVAAHRHHMHAEQLHRAQYGHAPRAQSPDYRHMPNVASPTLQHLIARADSVRSAGAAQSGVAAPRPHSAGSNVFPHAHVAHVHARSAAVRKLLLEAETRPHAVDEALAIWNSTDPSQLRGAPMSDSRSHATSSRSDFIQSMHAASGAVNTTPSRATDVHHTDFSASVIDSGTVPDMDVRSAGGAPPGMTGAMGSTFSGPVAGGLPRPWHTAHMRRVGESDRTVSASWEYAAASPTGTHASRVAPHSHGYSGAMDGPHTMEYGPASHSGYYHSVHQSVSSKSGMARLPRAPTTDCVPFCHLPLYFHCSL